MLVQTDLLVLSVCVVGRERQERQVGVDPLVLLAQLDLLAFVVRLVRKASRARSDMSAHEVTMAHKVNQAMLGHSVLVVLLV